MASKQEPGSTAPGPHVCSHCAKPFARLCDLNKHAKSHSRPFKCAIPTCKYHEHGWPTAKELERHNNDKHSVAPRTFSCLFPPCTYKSKRESNCKQHMEKTHRWKYIRSKSNGRRTGIQHHDGISYDLSIDGTQNFATAVSPGTSLISPRQDFVLFPYDTDQSVILGEDDDDDIGFDHPQGQDSQVYLPWTSPNTRIRRNENFIEKFTQTYNGAPERIRFEDSDSLIDPGLPQYTHIDLPGFRGVEHQNSYPNHIPVKEEAVVTVIEQSSPTKPESRKNSVCVGSPSERRTLSALQTAFHAPSHNERRSFPVTSTPAGQAAHSPAKGTSLRRRMDDDDNDDEDENQSPQKRRRSNPVENFTDTDMPDIFRFAHPRIYDRDQKEKYSPCHSSHRDISTLVRPAHRLHVTDRFISSFDINDQSYPHPRLGLCRRCWRAFPERDTFDDHISHVCDKVSKGKREKWRILLENFTPLNQHSGVSEESDHALISDGCEDLVNSRRPSNFEDFSFVDNREGENWAEHATPTTAAPSPAAPALDTFVPSGPTINRRFVPMNEHLRLQKEHRELHQKHQQLVQATKALFNPKAHQDSAVATAQRPAGVFLALRAGQLPGTLYPTNAPKPRPGSSTKDTSSDQESLVRNMDSQSTDVDIDTQGFMHEAQETLSRQNSGLSSTSRSTIHHVATSPPPLLSENADEDNPDSDPPQESTPSRRPPPSIPDSAYGTDPRRCSLGEQGGQAAPGSGTAEHPISSEEHHYYDERLALQHHHLHASNSRMIGVDESVMNRRKPVGPAAGAGEEAIAWGNPWDGNAPEAAGQTTTAQHTFVDGEVVAAGVPCEPIPTFDMYNFDDLGHFDDFFPDSSS
ncbi:hypothetical protein B0H66DRAFT_201723 [Apodospora peruviana]|uniref:C2H2-type domain-containing protein n=1 Tax=Apodospora peruviana TaxID=516989 RepID=A0AAE0ICC8_9PEZI|nr:hypothetical protein B0H66DRAFT_201723 [Apodospora peruviana]